MGKSFKYSNKYNNWHKDKRARRSKKEFVFGSIQSTPVSEKPRNYSPFEDAPEYHQSFA